MGGRFRFDRGSGNFELLTAEIEAFSTVRWVSGVWTDAVVGSTFCGEIEAFGAVPRDSGVIW